MKLMNPPTAIVPGTKTATTTPAAIAAARDVREVLLSAPASNAVDVLVGDSASQTFPMPPGSVLTMGIDNLAKVWVVTSSSTAVVNFIAEA